MEKSCQTFGDNLKQAAGRFMHLKEHFLAVGMCFGYIPHCLLALQAPLASHAAWHRRRRQAGETSPKL